MPFKFQGNKSQWIIVLGEGVGLVLVSDLVVPSFSIIHCQGIFCRGT